MLVPPRPERVKKLVDVANLAMLTYREDSTPLEVISAFMTMAALAIQIGQVQGVPVDAMRGAIDHLILLLPPAGMAS